MAREVPSIDVPLPSADLLQSAYESVRPHLKPEDVPAALTREVSPGACASSPETNPMLVPGNAVSDLCTTSYSPCSKMDQCSTVTSDACGAWGHSQDPSRAMQQALHETQGRGPEERKRDLPRKRKPSRLGGGRLRVTGADVEQRHERVIQHRDRSTTYTLGGPRCSRTDGKHWQCKREALPDQKYCEKHLHRGLLRSRKRKREDNFQDLEGERLFQGWQRAKPKVQLWPGLCQPPSEMDQSPASSQSGLPDQALFSIPSLHIPLPVGSPLLTTGPQAALGQWTPAQEQILKATLSELGFDENNALLGSSSAIAELRAQSLKLELEGSPWGNLPCDPTGPPKPLPPLPKPPNVLRVGQDQAVLPPSVHFALNEDGSFMVAIPVVTLASVGVGVNADGLISTWGCGVPIHIAFGGTPEVVKLEALRRDGDAVVFKGRARANLGLASREGEGRSFTPADPKSAAPQKRGAFIPWEGDAMPNDSADVKGPKGLDLDLNLQAADLEVGDAAAFPSDPPSWKSPGAGFDEKPPLSPFERGSSLGFSDQENLGYFSRMPDARPKIRPPNQSAADPILGLFHRPKREIGGGRGSGGASRAPANDGGAGLRRTVSLKVEKCDVGLPLQRTASLPVGFGLAPAPPKASAAPLSRLEPGWGGGKEGTTALGGLNLGGVGGALVGNVASVILQTPRGVFLGEGVKLDEIEKEDSCDWKPANQEKPRVLRDGRGSQSPRSGGSVSSPVKSRKRAREGSPQGVGFWMGGLTPGLVELTQTREKARRTDLGERALSTSLSSSELRGPAVDDLRAPVNGLPIVTGPHPGAKLGPFTSRGLEQPFFLRSGDGAGASFEPARGSELTAKDLVRPLTGIPMLGGSLWGVPGGML